MKANKKEKKARNVEKDTRALVKEAFNAEKTKGKSNPMVESLVKSVLVNRAVLEKEKQSKKLWQDDTYHQQLFFKFAELIDRHNEIYEVNIHNLERKIATKKLELKELKAEIKRYEANLELKETKKNGKAI